MIHRQRIAFLACLSLACCQLRANEPISGLPPPLERIIHELANYGDAVVPSLVDLLADSDVEVANMAGAALREIESIEPRHLPQIIEGLDRGVRWLPAALGLPYHRGSR